MIHDRAKHLAQSVPGWTWMVVSAGLFSMMGLTVRTLVARGGVSVFWVGVGMFLTGLTGMVLAAAAGCGSLRVHNRRVFVLRGVIGSIGQFLSFATIAYVGLARGTVLSFLMAVVGAVSGVLILGERATARLATAVGLATVGAILTCDVGWPRGAEWLGLGAALFSGTTLSLVRLLRRTDSNQVSLFSQCLFGCLVIGAVAWPYPIPTSPLLWAGIAGAGLLSMGGQLCMSQGFSMVPVGYGSALLMLTPVFSFLFGVMLLHEPVSAMQMGGCGAVLLACILAGQNGRRATTGSAPLEQASEQS